MDQNICKLYPFLKATRGCWRNAIFIPCTHDHCPYGHPSPCGGFLLAADADGSPLFLSASFLQEASGESVEPEECRAILSKQSFEAVYSLYIEWNTVSPDDCPLWQLWQSP